MYKEWFGELVIAHLEAAFQSKPDAGMYSVPAEINLSADGPMEGCRLIQATAQALGLDSPARIHLLYYARARGMGEPIYKLCRNRSWNRVMHYRRVTAASTAVAEWLNARAIPMPMLADPSLLKRGIGRPPTIGTGTTILIRCHKEFLAAVDYWRIQQRGDISRPDAIRLLAQLGLQTELSANGGIGADEREKHPAKRSKTRQETERRGETVKRG